MTTMKVVTPQVPSKKLRACLTFLVAALALPLNAQDGVYETLSVESTSSDAMDVAGGIELGVDLSAENGGVPETAIILINAATCPVPLVLFPLTGIGTLIACLYAPVGASQLGAAQLGSATLQ